MGTLKATINKLLVITLVALLAATATATKKRPPVAAGLSSRYYTSSCPHVASIIRNRLRDLFEEDIGLAAGLLRLHFHDCFVQVGLL